MCYWLSIFLLPSEMSCENTSWQQEAASPLPPLPLCSPLLSLSSLLSPLSLSSSAGNQMALSGVGMISIRQYGLSAAPLQHRHAIYEYFSASYSVSVSAFIMLIPTVFVVRDGDSHWVIYEFSWFVEGDLR